MTLYTLHQEPDGAASPVLVAHRFSWSAFVLGPFWLMAQRMWIPAAVVLLIDLGAAAVARAGSLQQAAALLSMVVVAVFVGLEGQEWRRRAMARRGSRFSGVVFGANEIEALARSGEGDRSAGAGE